MSLRYRSIPNLLVVFACFRSVVVDGFSPCQPFFSLKHANIKKATKFRFTRCAAFSSNGDVRRQPVSAKSSKKKTHHGKWSRRKFIASNAAASIASGFFVEEANAETSSIDESLFYGPVIPFSSRREYRQTTLANGLRVLLVSDKATAQATAALSIGGAGQFADPNDLPGLAHLMEHMCLSSNSKRLGKQSIDFEEWLDDQEGASNAFTAPGMVCFYFNSLLDVFQEALVRFGSLFVQETVEEVCKDQATLKREIQRVDGELDFSSDASRSFYMLKSLINPEHPFSRFSAGSKETLETLPNEAGIDVGRRLYEFFAKHYLPEQAVLVVVASEDLATLERWVFPYSKVLWRNKRILGIRSKPVPDPFLARSRLTQIVLLRSKNESPSDRSVELLTFQWPLKILYNGVFEQSFPHLIGAPAVGFVISQILSRRGPGSLYRFLLLRGWIPRGTQGLPRISLPVDLSGFQILKLEIGLTPDGFANRSAVVAAVYNSINAVSRISLPSQPFLLKREFICQYLTVANLFGFALAPRPPDAVELAVDAQTYGVGGLNGVGVPGEWPLIPSIEDRSAVDALTRAVADTLTLMSQPSKAVVTILASPSVAMSGSSIVDLALPPLSSSLWREEPLTNAKYYKEDMMGFAGLVEMWVAERLDEDELGPPTLNPLIPSRLRPPRPIVERKTSNGARSVVYLDNSQGPATIPEETVWREFLTQSPDGPMSGLSGLERAQAPWEKQAESTLKGSSWKLWQVAQNSVDMARLPLPLMPPEPSCRCAFVVQLLSARPARANVRKAAHAQLWQLSFEAAIEDLAALGAPGALAYDIGFNEFGLRICFLGISQTLPSYARRFCRRLVAHHERLAVGSTRILPATAELAVERGKRIQGVSAFRRRAIVSAIREATAFDAAIEGAAFLKSCSKAVCIAQGDLLPREAVSLLSDLQSIFQPITSKDAIQTALPELSQVLYRPMWKPSAAFSCTVPGLSLVCDACGRIQR